MSGSRHFLMVWRISGWSFPPRGGYINKHFQRLSLSRRFYIMIFFPTTSKYILLFKFGSVLLADGFQSTHYTHRYLVQKHNGRLSSFRIQIRRLREYSELGINLFKLVSSFPERAEGWRILLFSTININGRVSFSYAGNIIDRVMW